MGITVNALDLLKEHAKRELEREALVQEHLVALYLLVQRAGGRVEIPIEEIRTVPALEQLALSTIVVDHPEHGKTAVIQVVRR
jgi:hypothetical protein